MLFSQWLQDQTGVERTDTVGWLARFLLREATSQKNIEQLNANNGIVTMRKYAEAIPESKIRRSFIKAHDGWLEALKLAARPQIGIFWFIDGEVVDFAVDTSSIPAQSGGGKDGPYDHHHMWSQVKKLYPAMKYKDYASVPRGRVLWSGVDRSYVVYLPPDMIGDVNVQNSVIRAFSLPRIKTLFLHDEHYVTQSDAFEVDPFDEDFEPDMNDEDDIDNEY